MSYSPNDLTREITEQHLTLFSHNDGVAPKSWLVRQVLALHPDITGADADFAVLCCQRSVTAAVERHIRGIKENESSPTDPQLIMEGYEFLQKQYVIQRCDESAVVSIRAMTDDEIADKAAQHRAMGAGHYRHADELERYIKQRNLPCAVGA